MSIDVDASYQHAVALDEKARQGRVNRNWNAYYGSMPKSLKPQKTKKKGPGPDDSIMLPYVP